MTFGQHAGPPASAGQVRELLALLKAVGHTDFREARGPLGFTQRQAGGKFTRDEATGFIDALQDAEFERELPAVSSRSRTSATRFSISGVPAEHLAAELERRGWTVTAP